MRLLPLNLFVVGVLGACASSPSSGSYLDFNDPVSVRAHAPLTIRLRNDSVQSVRYPKFENDSLIDVDPAHRSRAAWALGDIVLIQGQSKGFQNVFVYATIDAAREALSRQMRPVDVRMQSGRVFAMEMPLIRNDSIFDGARPVSPGIPLARVHSISHRAVDASRVAFAGAGLAGVAALGFLAFVIIALGDGG